MNFAYGFTMAMQGLLIAPLEAQRLYPGNSSLALGAMASLCGAAQLVGPEVGYWSDAYRCRLGRRRPLLMISTSLILSSTFGLWFLSLERIGSLYLCVFFL